MKNSFNLFKKISTKNYLIIQLFRSKYCWLVFMASIVGGYFLIPQKILILNGWWYLIGSLYILTFAIIIACIARIIKERVVTVKNTGAGILAIVFAVLGIGIMQVCGVGAPICGATVGIGIFSLFFPSLSNSFLSEHGLFLIILSISIQLIALYYMKCFKSHTHKINITTQ